MFLPQVKDHTENTYYSDFISHLKNVKFAGKGKPTVVAGGKRKECECKVVTGGQNRVVLGGGWQIRPVRGVDPSLCEVSCTSNSCC